MNRTPHALTLLLLLCLALTGVAVASNRAWQTHESIRSAAVDAALRGAPEGLRADADAPDPRLKLPACPQPLAADLTAARGSSARVTAEVRCPGATPWRLFLPVRLTLERPVLVATRALARDTVLAPADVRLAPLPSGALGSGVLFDVEGAVGRRLRRPVDAGQVLTINQLMAATVVRRGQQVMLEAEAPGYVVRMAGVAQRDGALGDIIEVQNVNSGRTVQAVVRSAKSVQVLLQ